MIRLEPRRGLRLVVAAAACAALSVPAVAHAGKPGSWTKLTQGVQTNPMQATVARTSDGVLHVLWLRQTPADNTKTDLVHTRVEANGSVGTLTPVVTGFQTLSNPDVLVQPDGVLRVFFGGQRTLDDAETNKNLNSATSADGGNSWSLVSGTAANEDSAYASQMGVTNGPGGVPFQSWSSTGAGVLVHRGLDPATPNFGYQTQMGGCCGYGSDLGFDSSTGRLWIAWASNSDAPGKLGVFGQIVDSATGAPTGTPQVMPGTVINSEATGGNDKFDASLYRTPVAERVGGGVFVAYHGGTPQRTGVVVWRTGAPQSTLLTSAKADYVAVAAAPDGRIWVVWTAVSKGRTRVIARRSNKDGGSFGAPVSTTLPKGTDAIYNQSASSQEDLLDVVYHFDNESNSVGIADWHTQLLPGLTVKASKSKLVAGKKTKVTFKVTDAGDPVAGAKVKVGAKSGKTNKAGKVTLTLPAFKKGKKPGVVYTIAGYAKASSTLRVVRR